MPPGVKYNFLVPVVFHLPRKPSQCNQEPIMGSWYNKAVAHGWSLCTKFGHLVSIGRTRLFWREILLNLQKKKSKWRVPTSLSHTSSREYDAQWILRGTGIPSALASSALLPCVSMCRAHNILEDSWKNLYRSHKRIFLKIIHGGCKGH